MSTKTEDYRAALEALVEASDEDMIARRLVTEIAERVWDTTDAQSEKKLADALDEAKILRREAAIKLEATLAMAKIISRMAKDE